MWNEMINVYFHSTEICVPEVTGGELTYLSLIFAVCFFIFFQIKVMLIEGPEKMVE